MSLISNFLFFMICVICATCLFFKKKYSYWKNRNIPFLQPTMPLGNVILGQHFRDFFDRLYNLRGDNGIVGGYIAWKPILMPTSLDLIQNILVKDFNYFEDRGFYYNEKDDPLSAHIGALEGDHWRSIRTKISPVFTSSKMKFLFSTIVDVSERLHRKLAEIIQNEREIEISDIVGRYTTEVIGSCAFGIECNALNESNGAFQYYANKFFDEPHLNTGMLLLATYFPDLARRLHVTYTSKDVREFFTKCVRDTIEYREVNNVRRNDFMDLFIQLKNVGKLEGDATTTTVTFKLTHDQIAAEAFIFFMAGFETSKTAMTYLLYELARNPEIQEKVRKEIEDTIRKHGNKLTYEAVRQMTYMEKVINESFRMHPPIVFNNRLATSDYRIPNSSLVIEKGTGIFIPVYQIHHDPEIYENPEVFDPERFSSEQVKQRHPMAFLAFSEGPRGCIGDRFGRMQIRVGTIALLQKFRFKVSPKCRSIADINPVSVVMVPKNGVILQVDAI